MKCCITFSSFPKKARNPNKMVSSGIAIALFALATPSQSVMAETTKAIETAGAARAAEALTEKPNVLAIFGDDIGWFNLSIYNHGTMGYQTPNLDRIGKEGAMFTDAYAEQSCTAGRAAFLTGQHGLRTGMIKVGLPGVPFGLSHDDPTIAEALKGYGYATAQFGKNHLGDDNATLPTTHGFDEFFGNLYHLNAEEEPENPDYPDDPAFAEKFGPRGVLHSYAAGITPPTGIDLGTPVTEDTAGQTIYDTGPLTSQRMKTVDGVFAREAIRFMDEAQHAGKPFFVWYAATRMHVWTHLKEQEGYEAGLTVPEFDKHCYANKADGTPWNSTGGLCNVAMNPDYYAEGKTGLNTYPDGMVEHDMYAGLLLDYLDAASLTNNTVVLYTSDNGAETFTWPDGGTTPFRSEKNTNWEGAFRVPLLVRWPGVISPGTVSNDIIAMQDWFTTLIAAVSEAAGERIDIKALLKTEGGYELIPGSGKKYYVHLDGYDFLDHFRCATEPCVAPRQEFIYTNDDGVLIGIRYNDWKLVFHEQRAEAVEVWQDPFVPLRMPKIFNLRTDPFEKADHESDFYADWRFRRIFLLAPAQVAVYQFLNSFQAFPPRQSPPSFSVDVNVDDIIEKCGTADEPLPDNSECFPLPSGSSEPQLPGYGG